MVDSAQYFLAKKEIWAHLGQDISQPCLLFNKSDNFKFSFAMSVGWIHHSF